MKHLFVPYDIALIAKEKGFVDPCIAKYQNMKNPKFPSDFLSRTDWDVEFINIPEIKQLAAPLYQQLIDWFRNKHDIVIWIETAPYVNMFNYRYYIETYDNKAEGMKTNDYYEALNEALIEGFKLIK